MKKVAKKKESVDPRMVPIGFAKLVLGLNLYPWQEKAVAPLRLATGKKARRINIAVAAPNGAGKERIISSAAHWWSSMHRRGRVVITSSSDLQLSLQTINEIDRHREKLGYAKPNYSPRYEMTTPTGGKIIAFVTKEAGRVEGWHKEDDVDGPLLLIVNEAKTVQDPIFEGFDRCTPNAVLMVSSTGLKRGRFYDAFTRLRSSWICVKASLEDCPHIPKDRVQNVIDTYGIDHPFTRSTLYAEFMDQDEVERFIVSLLSLEFAIQNPPNRKEGFKAAFCDFADGGAENVVAFRDGNKLSLEGCWRESNKLASVARFISIFRKLKLEPSQITGDAADKEMCDLLAEAGWSIKRQNFGSPANDSTIYLSWGAEAWREFGIAVDKNEWILPNDPELVAQLTTRLRTFGRSGKLGAEEKYAMRKRGLKSPDRADAIVGVAAQRDYSYALKGARGSNFFDEEFGPENSSYDDQSVLTRMGAQAGYG
jgi:phage terminase large subunit